MRDDPFARLSGLDQRLFVPSSPAASKGRRRDASKEAEAKSPSGRPNLPVSQGASRKTERRVFERPLKPEVQKERLTERHPYDFFRDQILWLNRVKVEIQEQYGRRVTANAIVQLALDLLIEDYRRRGRRSSLISSLVLRSQTEDYPGRSPEEPSFGRTFERPSGKD